MKVSKFFLISLISLLLAFGLPLISNAELIDNGDGTITQFRDDGTILMWLKDANLAYTSGYDADGLMTWSETQTWIDEINDPSSIYYMGYSDWQLPNTNPVNGLSYDYSWSLDGSTDRGYNISASGSAYPGSTGSDMAYMFYTELGNLGYYDTSGDWPQAGWGLGNSGLFSNLEADFYWSNFYYTPDSGVAWFFNFDFGVQNGNDKTYSYHAWAVRVVPEPMSSTLFIIGGATLGLRRFRKKFKK